MPSNVSAEIKALLQDKVPRNDFRDSFALESARTIADFSGIPPEDIGVSLCYFADTDGKKRIKEFAGIANLIGLLGMVVFFGGGIPFVIAVKLPWLIPASIGLHNVYVFGGSIECFGFAVLLATLLIENAKSKKRLATFLPRRSYAPFAPNPTLPNIPVVIEDVQTAPKPKLNPDDVGLLVFDEPMNRVIIEGLAYRYVIHAEDVEAIEVYEYPQHGPAAVLLTYRIGDKLLSLVIARKSFAGHAPFAHGKMTSWFLGEMRRVLRHPRM